MHSTNILIRWYGSIHAEKLSFTRIGGCWPFWTQTGTVQTLHYGLELKMRCLCAKLVTSEETPRNIGPIIMQSKVQ